MQSIPILQIDHLLNTFQIKAKLGKGAFGNVYKVLGPDQQIYALKCIYKRRFKEANGCVGELIMNEVNALKQLQSQFIVNLKQTFECNYEDETIFCILLEYCDNGNLLEYLQKNYTNFDQQKAIVFFKQILQGMQMIHQKRIIHRDLKLPNILVHQDQIKIADFGFCHILEEDQNQVKLNLGSLGTQAPEVLNNEPYGLKSDMFSIGVILYQLLFFSYPFSVTSKQDFLNSVTSQNPPSFKKNGKLIEKYLEDLLTKMLKKDPNERLDWHALFKSKLFQNSYSQMFGVSTIEDESIIDPIKSYIYYKQQIKTQFLESSIQKIEKTPKYIDLQSQIKFLTYTYEFSYKVHHRQVLMCIIPCFLILKQLYYKQQLYQSQNKHKIFDLALTHQYLTYQYQVVMANLQKIKQLGLIEQDWEEELINLSISSKFQTIFSQVVKKYLLSLKNEILKDSEEQKIEWQDILLQENNKSQQEIKKFISKLKFFILIHKVLSLEEIKQELFQELINDIQDKNAQLVDIYQNIVLS
ncbi:unnamed protein product [Paramecium sonneborni]|uniref:Protein kinase domain-containing protein n=1 Tax=Paramecium sonneborni TaxID=65129 RepID=A0A8S1MMR0_9CILI|nr:unnamed protein product [Paramecium sonneborni]